MKRDDITALFPDATKEQIDKLMAINGADINAAKGDLDAVKNQLTTAQGEIETLKKNGVNADELTAAKERADALQAQIDGMKQTEAVRLIREKVAKEKKVPVELLTGATEDECASMADSILAFAKPTYPRVQDGGEVGSNHHSTTREQFAEWAKDNI